MQQRHHHKKGFELLRSNSETIAHKTRMGFNLSSLNSEAIGQPCKGFSLVEAAVVLGVIGLVVGGIWYAASAVIDKWRADRLASGILTMVEGTRKLFPINAWPIEAAPGQTSIEITAIAAGIVPSDLVNGNYIRNTMENDTRLDLRLIYPPLLSERYIYFFTPSTTQAKANAFLVAFLSPLRNTKNQIYRCYCSNGSDIWNYYNPSNWPPNCPPLSASGYISVACYMYP